MIPWLASPAKFPETETALVEPNGLLCAGGNLQPETIVAEVARMIGSA